MSDLLYRGTPVFFNGQNYIVPPLSIGQFEDNYEKLTKVEEITDKASLKKRFATLLPVILTAIKRNYPDVTLEVLRDHLDLATFKECLQAAQSAVLREAAPGEA